HVTGVQTCALPISGRRAGIERHLAEDEPGGEISRVGAFAIATAQARNELKVLHLWRVGRDQYPAPAAGARSSPGPRVSVAASGITAVAPLPGELPKQVFRDCR